MEHFTRKEVECNCGCGYYVSNLKLFDMIDRARTEAGVRFDVNSWCRCVNHNIKIGGSATSSHVLGEAIDISYKDDEDLHLKVKALHEVGFVRVLAYPKSMFIHVDISSEKKQPIFKIMEQG